MDATFNGSFTATGLIDVFIQTRYNSTSYEKILSFGKPLPDSENLADFLESNLTGLTISIDGNTLTGFVNSMSRNLSENSLRVQIKCDMI